MAFIFYAQDVSSMFRDFNERFVSGLALRGTEITNERRGENSVTFDVMYIGEKGTVLIEPSNRDVRATYTVEREKKEVKRGLMGAIAGAGVGGLLGGAVGSILNRDGEGLGDSITGALGGAAAGGAYEAYNGYEESRQERTGFAAVLAETMKEVEEEIHEILVAQEEARQARSEKAKEREREDSEQEDDLRSEIEDVYGDLLALIEEVRFAEADGRDMKRINVRLKRAEELYSEAVSAVDEHNFSGARAKLKAFSGVVAQSQDMLNEE